MRTPNTPSIDHPPVGFPWRFAALAVAGLLVVSFIDGPLHRWLPGALPGWTGHDNATRGWFKMFRMAGYIPVWLIVSAAFVLIDQARIRGRGWGPTVTRGAVLTFSVLASGALGEVLKFVIRRQRPGEDGVYVFHGWFEPLPEGVGLGMPSTHAIVAWAAAWALCRLHPQAAPVWLFFALGCSVQRVCQGSHFLSDVYVSAVLAWAVVNLMWQWHLHNTRRGVGRYFDDADPGAAGPGV